MRRLWLLAVLMLMSHSAWAESDKPVTDPAQVNQHYCEVVARPEFQQVDETSSDLQWNERISLWLKHIYSRFHNYKYMGQLSDTARVLVVIITVAAVGGMVLLLVRLSRRRWGAVTDEVAEFPPGAALLSPRQYETRLHRALEERDWQAAWMAAWLQFLARLESRHLVEADRSRTNREYLSQLRGQSLPEGVLALLARLVDDYDRFIYGRRTIDEEGWSTFRDRIGELTLMLGLRERGTEEPA